MEEGTANPDIPTQHSGNKTEKTTKEGRKEERHPIDQVQESKEAEYKHMEAEATNPDDLIRQSRKK